MRWRSLRSGPTAAILGTAVAGLVLLACSPPAPPGDSPPPPGATTTPGAPSSTEVAIGVDELSAGFNPHTLADLSPTTAALSGLLLPSAFRQDSDGSWQLDRTLLLSAKRTSDNPFTITYRLRSDAAWSDTAPIAAEDFVYLAEQMRTQPGVVDPAGYQLIDQVRSRHGGKTVEVVFRQPYPGWRTLFNDLLPAHLLKDAPGGWADALDDGIPVSGGPYAIRSQDPARGQLVLERNDRYWANPAVLDRVVLREEDAAALAEALRSGDQQIAMLTTPDAIGVSTFAALGDAARLTTVPRPVVASVLLRPASEQLADDEVRQAVAAALDRDALIATGTASGPSTRLRAEAHVLAPSQLGYLPTIAESGHPVASGPAVLARLLTDAGYHRERSGWTRNGETLRLVVAAPDERYPYVTLAQRVADQLADAGIPTELVTPEGDVLFGTLLDHAPQRAAAEPVIGEAGAEVDIAVVPQPAGGDPATVLASRYGCPPVVPPGQPQPPPNPASFCELSLQPFIEGALSGTIPLADALAVVEPALWRQVPAVPLFQEAAVLASTAEVSGVAPGGLLAGPFADLARWRRPRR